MKLTKEQKAERKAMLDDFDMQSGLVFSNADAGFTIAAAPAARGDDCRFVKVAIAQCDFIDDEFKRKVGEYLALERFYAGETFSIPTHTVDDAIQRVADMLQG